MTHIQKVCFTVLFSALMGFSSSTSALAAANSIPFSIQSAKPLHITWHGQPLITGDHIAAIGPKTFNTSDGSKTKNLRNMTVTDVWHSATDKQPISYRREVATNGKKIELAVQFCVPAYYKEPKGGSNTYGFSVPLKALVGMTYKAVTGRGYQWNIKKGKISADMPDGEVVYTRYIAFKDPTGKKQGVVFDFNPKGPEAFNDYGPTVLQGYWRIDKVGDELYFYFGRSPSVYGGVINSIIRIREGKFSDYSKYHAHKKWHYYDTFPALKQLSFGHGKTPKDWINGNKTYSKLRGFGWMNTNDLRTIGNRDKDVLHGMTIGNGKQTLRLDVPQPGVYIVTVRTGSPKNKVGPFTLIGDKRTAAKDVIVRPGKIRTLTFCRYPTDGHIDLTWQGKSWTVSTVAVQAMVYKPQDFAIKRGVWLMKDIPTPTNLFMFERHSIPAKAASETIKVVNNAASNVQVRAAKMKPLPVVAPSGNDPDLAWRWKGSITSMGPGNFGSFYEFTTDKQINRRLDQLQSSGFNTILLNGLLVRHVYPEQIPRVTKTVARIVKLAHARDMHVLDHQDLTIMCTQDAGLKYFVDHIGWMLRDITTGAPTRGIDLTNPHFRKHYWKYMTDYVKATNIDGLMIDEVTFQKKVYSGSQYARQKFYEATGLRLPTDNDGKIILNHNSHLWRLWLRWRMRATANWYVQLRKHVEKVKPNFVLMKYTTNYGLTSHYATIAQGSDITKSTVSVGWIGTEIMSRNVYATYRSNYAYRSIFNTFRSAFGTPVFGLVYPVGQPVYAYSGWAVNNMHAQATWALTSYKAVSQDSKRYMNWPKNMNHRKAKHVTHIAVLFSPASRNFGKYFAYTPDLVGTLECLDDMHQTYDVLLSRDMTVEKLQKYKLLILPSTSTMSDEQLNAILAYLRQGGHVLATGNAAILDNLGFERKIWPIGRWLGLKFTGKILHKRKYELTGNMTNNRSVEFNSSILYAKKDIDATVQPEITMYAKYGKINAIAGAWRHIGKGTIFYVAPRLGAAIYEKDSTIGRKWTYQPKPELQKLLGSLIKRAYGKQPKAFDAIKIPSTVYVNVFRQPIKDDNNKTETLVHLYNGSGVKHTIGKPVPRHQPTSGAFPIIKTPMVFNITLPNGASKKVTGIYYSPDKATPKSGVSVNVKPLGKNKYQVIVPKGTLRAYGIIYLQTKGQK